MKKFVLLMIVSAGLLAACDKKVEPAVEAPVAQAPVNAEEKVLNIYNWPDYIPEGMIAAFEKETGIKVSYDTFKTDEVLDAKLVAGNTGYDIVVPRKLVFNPKYTEKLNYSSDPADYQAAARVLGKVRKDIRLFSSLMIDEVAGGLVCAVIGWSGDINIAASRARENGSKVNYPTANKAAIAQIKSDIASNTSIFVESDYFSKMIPPNSFTSKARAAMTSTYNRFKQGS